MTDTPAPDQQPLETLSDTFQRVTDDFMTEAKRKLELARAVGDKEAAIKEHIKLGTMHAARGIFRGSHYQATKRWPWHED